MSEPVYQPNMQDSLSKKNLAKWGREELSIIQERFTDITLTREVINSKLLDAVAQRAIYFAEKSRKLLIKAIFPLPSGIPENVNYTSDRNFFRIFPDHIEVQETWICFNDKSLIFLATPSEKTRSFGRFILELRKNQKAASIMGVDTESIIQSREIITLAEYKHFISPISPNEFHEFILKKRRQFSLLPSQYMPHFYLNLKETPSSTEDMLNALENFPMDPEEKTMELISDELINLYHGEI